MIDTRSSKAAVQVQATRSSAGRKWTPAVEAHDRPIVGRTGSRRRRLTPKMAGAREEARRVEEVASTEKENVDHGALHSGSRVLVLCEEGNEWKATIKRWHEKTTGQRGFKIHYDGMKRSVEHWVPEDRVVASLDEVGKRRRLRPPEKSRPAKESQQPANTSPVQRPRPVSDASDIVAQKACRPDATDDRRCNAIKVFICDDFDLFNGELLRSATRDEVLKDL